MVSKVNNLHLLSTAMVAVVLLSASTASGQIYRWTDENGQVQFSDKPPPDSLNDTNNNRSDQARKQTRPDASTTKLKSSLAKSVSLKIRKLLMNRQFSDLNTLLETYQQVAAEDLSQEWPLFTAYDAFNVRDKNYRALLDEWVRFSPDSYQPYLARGYHTFALGWEARGNKWSSETPQENIDQMNGFFDTASGDAVKAIALNPNSVAVYSLQLRVAYSSGDKDAAKAHYQNGYSVSPGSFQLRVEYFNALRPRWGGSVEEMRALAEESLSYADVNPKLKLIPGYLASAAAIRQSSVKAYGRAIELYTLALELGENHDMYFGRGKDHYRKGLYPEALRDLDRAIELYPEISDYFRWRSKTHSKLENWQLAQRDIELGALLEPDNVALVKEANRLAAILAKQGYDLGADLQYTQAVNKLSASLRLNPRVANNYYWRARFYADNNQLGLALRDVKQAIEMDPDHYTSYALLDWILFKSKDLDQIAAYWTRYIKRNPNNSKAYLERGGTYHHMGDRNRALADLQVSADMGNATAIEHLKQYDR